jgi:hypothetical protein
MFGWLFGGSGTNAGAATPPPTPAGNTLDALSSGITADLAMPKGLDSFDPTVLERIATAARELSKNGVERATCAILASPLCDFAARF